MRRMTTKALGLAHDGGDTGVGDTGGGDTGVGDTRWWRLL